MDFESLYRRYARDVYRFALYLSGRTDLADDITAETFVRAWLSPGPIREGTVKAYLFAIARNLYRSSQRQAARHEVIDDQARDLSPDPEAATAARIELDRLLVKLQDLSEVDRTVLLMRTADGMSYEEISAAAGISVSAAKVKVHRARLRLGRRAAGDPP